MYVGVGGGVKGSSGRKRRDTGVGVGGDSFKRTLFSENHTILVET